MIDRSAIARESMRAALQVRRSLVISREQPVNPFEVAQALGIDVWFTDTPSLEGMFARTDDARIILPCLSHRPLGRLCFSCAHELGHAQLGHGNRVDQYVATPRDTRDPEEFAADVFASSLLMPRPAVLGAFRVRDMDPASAADLELLSVAFELCVGLEALVKHLHWGLGLINKTMMQQLLKLTPKSIRRETFGARCPGVIVPLDDAWRSAAVDLEVGHAIAVRRGTVSPQTLLPNFERVACARPWDLFVARHPGTAMLEQNGVAVALRIARTGFTGPWRYRYLQDGEVS